MSAEHILLRRVNQLPADVTADYATGEGQEDMYRYLGLQTKYPWGAIIHHKHMCNIIDSVTPTVVTTTALRGSMFHFILDGVLELPQNIKVKRWTLKLGRQIIQNIDSWFASDVAVKYKHGGYPDNAPFFFSENLLKVIPLFMNNSLPLIFEFELDKPVPDGFQINLFCEYATSKMESSGYNETYIQFIPNFITTEIAITPETTQVETNLNSRGKVVKCLYFRVFDDDKDDIDDVVKSIELRNGEEVFPSSLCRKYFKKKFGNQNLPYYVLPFCPNPKSSMPEYGEVFKDDKFRIIFKDGVLITGKKVEITLETVNKIAWLPSSLT